MNVGRFNYERRPNAPSSLRPAKYARPKWIRVSHVGGGPFLRDSGSPERRRIFAIVAPPKVDVSGKAIQRILIFDDHPDSFRLVSRLHVRPDDLAATRRAHPVYLIFALLLMLALSVAMFWPLIMRCHSL
jgi:hypothetical protein